jgi:hyperosmotically inducible periplasmic protein
MRRGVLSLALAASLSTLPACATSSSGGRAIAASTDDASITARVKTALLNDTQVNATKIDVSTSNGVVTMTGTVRSQPEQQRAIQLARQVNGVKDVKANLTIGS